MFSVSELINENAIGVRFQPIVSIRTRSIIGFEALSFARRGGEVISPLELFSAAQAQGFLVELDRHCRSVALRTWGAGGMAGKYLLFINFESALIDLGVRGSGFFCAQCADAGVPYSSVVIEIVESEVNDDAALEEFVSSHRSQGFVIAIDDVGEGHSNLNRIALLCPDILKADRTLAVNIDTNFTRQRIVSSLAGLSRSTGSLFLLEGLERESEVLTAFALGADLAQGYYLAHPGDLDPAVLRSTSAKITALSQKVREQSIARINGHSEYLERCFSCLEDVASCLRASPGNGYDECLANYRDLLTDCECMYVIDERGIQSTATILSSNYPVQSRPSLLFSPAPRGSDHSLKEYFYAASLHKRRYSSDRYVSLATGKLCITFSLPFDCLPEKANYYLCADFSAPQMGWD